MTDLFAMDDDEPEVFQLISRLQQLNYRLLDEPEEHVEEANAANNEPAQPIALSKRNVTNFLSVNRSEDALDGDTVPDLPRLGIPMKVRRRSSVSSAYEVELGESYVSSSVKSDHLSSYRPKLADFEPIRVLGQGSYGKVILVKEKSTGKLFAQKQLHKASLVIKETNEVHQTNYQRTLNEKTILEKVAHPNIVKLYYAFQDQNKVYLILEYLDGGELFHHLAQQKFLSERDASYYIAQIALALRYLHNCLKVIYRDLKPENCMLNSEGNLVLTDFGLSKVSSRDENRHSMIGTAQYMAPEVILGNEYDFSVDWWSLGCVAFDMLTGSPPFTGHTNEKIMDKVTHSKKYLKFPYYLSADAKDLLRKLLQPDPQKRLNVDTEFEKFKNHRFFRYLDWGDIDGTNGESSKVLPPIMPVITDPILAENFDDEFTSMSFTPHDSRAVFPASTSLGDILHVNGFTYTNESYLITALKDRAG